MRVRDAGPRRRRAGIHPASSPPPPRRGEDRGPGGADDAASDDEYPAELERDLGEVAGRTLFLRPVRGEDADRLVAFHARLSPDSIYLRYFVAHPLLSDREAVHLTHVDYVERLALVIVDGADIVAIGRYDWLPSTTEAEVAFLVRDDVQHRGLGRILLNELAAAAWSRGITRFSAVALRANRGMIALFEHSGFPVTSSRRDDEYMVSFPIDPAVRVDPHTGARTGEVE